MTDVPPPLDPDPTTADEREILLGFLRRQRAFVLATADGLTDEQARWAPPEGLLLIPIEEVRQQGEVHSRYSLRALQRLT